MPLGFFCLCPFALTSKSPFQLLNVDWFKTSPGSCPRSLSLSSSKTASCSARSVGTCLVFFRISNHPFHASEGTQSGGIKGGEALASLGMGMGVGVGVEAPLLFRCTAVALRSFLFNALACPASERCCCCRLTAAYSSSNLPCVQRPFSMVKNSAITGLIRSHCRRESLVYLASSRSSSGRLFSRVRQLTISSNRYAPCSVVLRCKVSPR